MDTFLGLISIEINHMLPCDVECNDIEICKKLLCQCALMSLHLMSLGIIIVKSAGYD